MSNTTEVTEIPIENFQNTLAKSDWGSFNTNQCSLCGKKVGKSPMLIHYLTNGNITSKTENEVDNSQGYFEVGSECAKKLPPGFAHASF